MTAIPDDVWAQAKAAWTEAYTMRTVGPYNALMPIAKVIMAERERLLSMLPKFVDAITAEDIAAAIRKGEAA